MSAVQQALTCVNGVTTVDIGDNIANSLMLDSASSQLLSRTTGTPTGATKFVFSTWVKRGKIPGGAAAVTLFSTSASGGTNVARTTFEFNASSDVLTLFNYNGATFDFQKDTTAKFRDPAAHFHALVSYDSTQTATDRVRIYVNGVSFALSAGSDPTASFSPYACQASKLAYIGAATTPAAYFDGYLSNTIFVDGKSIQDGTLAITDFGRTSADTGQWVNKTYAGTYGNNGFKLDFANSADLGNDVSGNNNDWTTNGGISSSNQYTDTPTNSYAVMDVLTPNTSTITIGNLKQVVGTYGAGCNFQVSSGKWVAECIWTATNGPNIGIYPAANYSATLDFTGANGGVAYNYSAGNKVVNGASTGYGSSYATGDVIRIELDLTSATNTVTFFKNGTSQGAINLTSGLSWKFGAGSNGSTTTALLWNFGQCAVSFNGTSTTYRSGAGGYFIGTPTTGYLAPCTANLPTPTVVKSTTGFVASATAESSIYSQVAADVSGWSAYVQILKNRTAAESWVWTFSHDATNEYAVTASSCVRQAVRAMSGSDNWIGYSLRIGAAYGTAAGSVSHTSGADTTVTHNIGISTRQVILLFLRSGAGTTVPVYHADLTAGKLLDLCTGGAEATLATIKTVTSNSFKIDTGAATGTYDYLVITELDGFSAVRKWAGNSSSDGTFAYDGLKARARIQKNITVTSTWRAVDTARDTYNVVSKVLYPSQNVSEATAGTEAYYDMNSNGFKLRVGGALGVNTTGETMVYVDFAEAPLKYSTGR